MPRNCFPEIAGCIGLGGVIAGIAAILAGAATPIIIAAFAVAGGGALIGGLTYKSREREERDALVRDAGKAEVGASAAAANTVNRLEDSHKLLQEVQKMRQALEAEQEARKLLQQQMEAGQEEAVNMRADLNALKANPNTAKPDPKNHKGKRHSIGLGVNSMFHHAAQGEVNPSTLRTRVRVGLG